MAHIVITYYGVFLSLKKSYPKDGRGFLAFGKYAILYLLLIDNENKLEKGEKRMKQNKKKAVLVLLMLGMMFTLAACGANSGGGMQGNQAVAQVRASDYLEDIKKMLSADGREYGDMIVGGMNETLTCSFFDFEVTGVKSATELAGYQPTQNGYKFVVADITVKNVFDEPIPVGNYDFNIVWNGGDDYAFEEFMEGMYPDDVELAVGETLSGALVFQIPEDINEFIVVYEEFWDDDFQGNTYTISCKL